MLPEWRATRDLHANANANAGGGGVIGGDATKGALLVDYCGPLSLHSFNT